MSDTADTLAANPDSGANQTGSLSLMDAAARFGALERGEAEPPAEEEPADGGQPEAEQTTEADESAEAEEGDEPEDNGEPEDEPAGTKPEPRPDSFDLKLPDGSTAKVNLEELKQGYLRDSDYRRKTHELGQQRRQLEAERAKLEEVVKNLGPLAPEEKEPDWTAEFSADPIGAAQKFAEWTVKERNRAAAREEAAKAQQERAAKAQAEHREHLQRQRDTLLAHPDFKHWTDEKKAARHQQQLRSFAESVGFSSQDLDGVTDHRVLVVLEQARKFQELSAKGQEVKKVATPAPKSQKPGPATDNKTAVDERLAQSKKTLARSGSAADAARVMALLNKTK